MLRLGHRSILSILAILLCVSAGTLHLAAQQLQAVVEPDISPRSDFAATGLTIAKRVDEVNLVFTVTDSHGKFIRSLPSSEFEFLDNHRTPLSLGYFQQQSDLPLRVALLIDLSDSIRGRFQFEQKAASVFLRNISSSRC